MKLMIPIIGTTLATLVSGCSLTGDAPPVAVQPDKSSVCTALAPTYPLPEVSYSEKNDSPVTVGIAKKDNVKYREANARFNAACK